MSLVSDSPSRLVLITKLHGHNDPVWAIRWRPGTHQLVSCSGKSLLLWDRKQEINSSIEDSNGLSLWTLKVIKLRIVFWLS
jgi:WD40 repeat protein